MNKQKRESNETLCSHCGAQAIWNFADVGETIVEISCPDCGRFELPRTDFEQAQFEMAQADERRT